MHSSAFRPVPFVLVALASLGCAAAPLNPTSVSPRVAERQAALDAAGVPAAAIECAQPLGTPAEAPAAAEQAPATTGLSMADTLGAGDASAVPSHEAARPTAGAISRGVLIRTLFEGRGSEGRTIPAPAPRVVGEHELVAPIRDESMVGHGSIAPDVIQRIVRQGLGQAQACYEYGRMRDPNLAGTVNVAFVIGGNGAVWRAKATQDSDLADPKVVTCIEQSFYLLSFPKPENGMFEVTYPLVFGPNT